MILHLLFKSHLADGPTWTKFRMILRSKDLLGEIQQDSDASVRYEALCSLQKIIDRVGVLSRVCGWKFARDSGIPPP